MNFKRRGFTLAEVLITLGIAGVLAVLIIPNLMSNIQNKTLSAQIKSFVTNIQQIAGDQLVQNRSNNLAVTDFSAPIELLSNENFAIAKCDGVLWANGYNSITGGAVDMTSSSKTGANGSSSCLLKNGVLVNYKVDNSHEINSTGEYTQGYFIVDVNGSSSPNVIGRDVFGFYITEKGRIISPAEINNSNPSEADCSSGDEGACFGLLVENNWEINY